MTKASEDGRTTLTQSHRQYSGSDPMMTMIADQLYDLIISRKRHYSPHVPTTWLSEMSTFRYALHGPSLHRATLRRVGGRRKNQRNVKSSRHHCQSLYPLTYIWPAPSCCLPSVALCRCRYSLGYPHNYNYLPSRLPLHQPRWWTTAKEMESDFLLTEIFARHLSFCFFCWCCCYDAINCLRYFSHWVLVVG